MLTKINNEYIFSVISAIIKNNVIIYWKQQDTSAVYILCSIYQLLDYYIVEKSVCLSEQIWRNLALLVFYL